MNMFNEELKKLLVGKIVIDSELRTKDVCIL